MEIGFPEIHLISRHGYDYTKFKKQSQGLKMGMFIENSSLKITNIKQANYPFNINKTFYYVGELYNVTKNCANIYVIAMFDDEDSAIQYAKKHNFNLFMRKYSVGLDKLTFVYDWNVNAYKNVKKIISISKVLV